MRSAASYISNSTTLALTLATKHFPSDCVFGTADVTNLYPSIPTDAGLRALRLALIKAHFCRADIDFVVDLAHLILTHNVMSFGNTYWLQINGTAMGSPMAVTYASIYLTILELEIFATCRQSLSFRMPLLYFRYIDDLFYISTLADDVHLFFTTLDGYHPSVRITSDIRLTEGIFLDVEAYKGPDFTTTGLLSTRLYQKPINSYLYIPPTSFHQPAVFPSFISAELRRCRLLCSDDAEFETATTLFYSRLVNRGYTPEFLRPLFTNLPNRISLLHSVSSRHMAASHTSATTVSAHSHTPAPLVFSVPFTHRTLSLHLSRILRIPQHLRNSVLFDMICPNRTQPIVCFRRAPNLRDLLVPSAYPHHIVAPQHSTD
jgi:hypothetical protein